MNFAPYLLRGLTTLINNTVTINSVSIPCIFNECAFSDAKDLGFDDLSENSVMFDSSLVSLPKSLIGKTVMVDGQSWRVLSVKSGRTSTTLNLISTDRK